MLPFRFQMLFFENSRIGLLFELIFPFWLCFRAIRVQAQLPPPPVSNLIHYRGERTAHPLWKPLLPVWEHFIRTEEEGRHSKPTSSVGVPSSCSGTFEDTAHTVLELLQNNRTPEKRGGGRLTGDPAAFH